MYVPPSIGAAGLTIPSYDDIMAYYIAQVRQIYGQQIYLGNDSAIYELLSIVALKASDANLAMQLVYNNRGPATAVGAGLDGILPYNGLARLEASYSTAEVTITGTAGTVITNGICQDVNGFYWLLPQSVTIGGGGTVSVTATCQSIGAIQASIGQINIRSTPTAGWSSVTNPAAAIPGNPVETDSQARARQAVSTSLPSLTMLDGTIARLEATSGVTRNNVVENYTGTADKWGNPAHSISCVVEGATDTAVATAIFGNKGIGAYPNGTTVVLVTSPITGNQQLIRFDRPAYIGFTVIANIHLINGSSALIAAIKTAIVNYLNSLQIGELLTISGVYAAVLTQVGNISQPFFSIHSLTLGYTSVVTVVGVHSGGGGSGYSNGDLLIVNQSGSSLGAIAQVTSNSGGAVTGVQLYQDGVSYTTATAVSTIALTGVGIGCTLDITAGTATNLALDVGVAFNQVAQGVTGNVTVNSV